MSNTLFTQPDILLIIGLIITILSACILLFKAFNTSIFWGLAYLFIPFASLLFIAVYWQKTYAAFLMSLLGVFLVVMSFVFHPEYLEILEEFSTDETIEESNQLVGARGFEPPTPTTPL